MREEITRRVSLITVEDNDWKRAQERLSPVEIIFSTWGMPTMDEQFLERFPKLRAVFYAAGDPRFFITRASQERGIVVCSAKEANAIPTAEYAVSAILLSLKQFWQFARRTHQTRSWKREVWDATGTYQSVVGLLALGSVGRNVAKMLLRHEVKLLAHDPYLAPEQAAEWGVELVSLEELFSRSDVVSVHLPLLPETTHLVNERLLLLMKPNATFINTARGALVDEADLISVLRRRGDLTAILDVTWPEPPAPDSEFYTLENVILTPHIAGSLGSEVTRLGRWMVDEMHRFLDGRPLQHRVIVDKPLR